MDEWWPQVRGEQWHVVGMFFLCTAEASEVALSSDHAAGTWVSVSDALQLELTKGTPEALIALNKNI